jgi:peptidoglycan/LPS O-acetylase OafA/YrhL
MRAVAALSVVYYHTAFRFPQPTGELQRFATQRNAGPPITAVVLFFLISGFVLYRPFVLARMRGARPPALVPYFVKRFARIVPGYWVALAISSAWLGYGYVFRPTGFIRYFGFLQLYGNHTTAGGGLSVAWTLCVEVSFYVALPLLALAARALGRRLSLLGSELAVCGAMVAASLVWQLAITLAVSRSNGWFLSLLSMLPGSLDLFAAGMVLAIFSAEQELRATPRRWVALAQRRTWVWWLLAGVALYFEGTFPVTNSITVAWMGTHALKLIGCALLLVPFVFGGGNRGLIRRVLGAAPVVWLGTVSYGIYLWHYPLLGKLAPHLHGELVTTLVVIAVSVAAGAVSYYLVERPAQLAARRVIARMRSRPGVVAPTPIVVGAATPPSDPP